MSLSNHCSQCRTYLGYNRGFCKVCGKELDSRPIAEDYSFIGKLNSEQLTYLCRGLHLTLPSHFPTKEEFVSLCITCNIPPHEVQRLIDVGPDYVFRRT